MNAGRKVLALLVTLIAFTLRSVAATVWIVAFVLVALTSPLIAVLVGNQLRTKDRRQAG